MRKLLIFLTLSLPLLTFAQQTSKPSRLKPTSAPTHFIDTVNHRDVGFTGGYYFPWLTVQDTTNLLSTKWRRDSSMLNNPFFTRFNYVGGYLQTMFTGSVSGWDQVLGEQGNIIKVGNLYVMIYTGFISPNTGTNTHAGIATSTDGKIFTREGTTGDGEIIPTVALEDPYIIYNPANSTYYLYAEDKSVVPFKNIRCFTSTDRKNWTDHGTVLDVGTTGSWEEKDVSSPCVKLIAGTFYLLYEGRALGQHGAIGLATSTDGFTFTKNAGNPLIRGTELSNPTFSWAAAVVTDDIIQVGGLYYLTIHGTVNNSAGFAAGMAVSSDLINWVDALGGDILKSDGNEYTGNGMMFHYVGGQYVPVYQSTDNTKLYSTNFQVKADYNVGGKAITTTGPLSAASAAITGAITANSVTTTGMVNADSLKITNTPQTWSLQSNNYLLVWNPTTKDVNRMDAQTGVIINSNNNGNALQVNAKFNVAGGTFTGGSGAIVFGGNTQTWSRNSSNFMDLITVGGTMNFRWSKSTPQDRNAMILGAGGTTNVQVAAGSTTITPFQILSGTLNTTPLAGAMENDGTDFYYVTNAGTRRTIANIAAAQTFTNKTISGLSNTITNIQLGSIDTTSATGLSGKYVNRAKIAWPGTLYSTPTTATFSTGGLTFSPSLASQSANLPFVSPNGSSGTPTFRKLVPADQDTTAIINQIFSTTRTLKGDLNMTGHTKYSATGAGMDMYSNTGANLIGFTGTGVIVGGTGKTEQVVWGANNITIQNIGGSNNQFVFQDSLATLLNINIKTARLTSLSSGTAGTDSLLSKDATTNQVKKISGSYYAPASTTPIRVINTITSNTTVPTLSGLADYSYNANSASQLTVTIPANSTAGARITVNGLGSGGWKILLNTGDTIVSIGGSTTTGTGSVAGLQKGSITIECETTGSSGNTWIVKAVQGTPTYL